MFPVFARAIIWTLINLGIIQLIKYGDHTGWNEITLSFLMIPVGIINCFVCFHSFYRLRRISREQIVYSLFGLTNSIYFFISWNQLSVLSGAMTN